MVFTEVEARNRLAEPSSPTVMARVPAAKTYAVVTFKANENYAGWKGQVGGGYGIFLNQWAYSVQTAFARNLPFFFTRQVDVPADVKAPTLQTRDILTSTTGCGR